MFCTVGIWMADIWITNFYLFTIQMPDNSPLFKPWPEYRTKSLLRKPSVTQPVIYANLVNFTFVQSLPNRLICFSRHDLHKEPLKIQQANYFGPFEYPTSSLFRSHCISTILTLILLFSNAIWSSPLSPTRYCYPTPNCIFCFCFNCQNLLNPNSMFSPIK